MENKLTIGKPLRVITIFAMPMLAGNIFQQFYSLADSIILGNFAGPEALAATGASFAVNFLLISVVIGLTTGCSVLISQLFGAGRPAALRRAVFTGFIFLVGLALILSVVFIVLSRPFLILLKTPSEIFEQSLAYLHILFGGFIFTLCYNTGASFLRAVGDSKTPLYFLIFASILNIILDAVFVICFEWGVSGAAWATVISQAVSALLLFLSIFKRKSVLRLSRKDIHFDTELLKKMLGYGIPATVQQLMVCLRMMIIQGLINSFGSYAVAGLTISNRIEMFAMMPIMNIGMALSTYVAQNIGAGRIDRVKKGFASIILLELGCGVFFGILIILLRTNLVVLFLGSDAAQGIMNIAVPSLGVLASFYFINAALISFNALLQGAGDMNVFMISSVVTLVSRIILAFSLVPFLGVTAVWWSNPISWVVGLCISSIRYASGRWKNKAAEVID